MKITQYKKIKGFSLVEMAIVLVILGFVLAALLLPLQAQREQLFQSQTENTLEIARKALLGYAQSQGRLPCPATAASNGLQDPLAGGACTVTVGFLPAVTLGIQPVDIQGFALDAWNNRIRYAVTQVNTPAILPATPDFTTANKASNVGITNLSPDLQVCSDAANCSVASYLVNNAVAVIFSTGRNFSQTAGIDETSNLLASPPNPRFFSRTPTASTAAEGEFDDIVTWISPFVLYNAMLQAGQLH
ncbi:MAG TPA: type II secretion system protein [Methylophilaceae bacterium]|nr:type II secretion system protein [Methylophilaceae bacterium]